MPISVMDKLGKSLPDELRGIYTPELVHIETRKDVTIFRLPEGEPFDRLWAWLEEESKRHKINCRREPFWPNLSELDEILSAIQWVWHRWIPRGMITMLAGEPGVGKSTIALDWLNVCIRGGKWPDGVEEKGGMLGMWLDTESGQQIINERSKSMGIDRKSILIPLFGDDLLAQPDLMNEGHQSHILTMIRATRPDMIVVDSLGSAHTGGENKVEEMRPIMSFLSSMARDHNAAVLLIHHLRKKGINETIDMTLDGASRVRGSGLITAYGRSVIGLEAIVEESIKVFVMKSNVARKPPILIAKFISSGDNITGIQYDPWKAPPPRKTKKERCAEWLYEYLKENGRQPVAAILEAAADKDSDHEVFGRSVVYDAREILDDALEQQGKAKGATWGLMKLYM